MGDSITIVGGGSLPLPVGQLNGSWPLFKLQFEDAGVTVKMDRWRWAVRVLGLRSDRLVWSYSWDQIERALVGPRKVVLYPFGAPGVRFVTLRKRRLDSLRLALARHDIAVEKISRFSFAGWALTGRHSTHRQS